MVLSKCQDKCLIDFLVISVKKKLQKTKIKKNSEISLHKSVKRRREKSKLVSQSPKSRIAIRDHFWNFYHETPKFSKTR